MNKSNLIKTTLISIIFLSLFSCSFTSQIASSLWSKELLGSIRYMKFASEHDIIATSSRGINSKINLINGDIQWRKPNVYDGEYEIETTEHYSLIVNRKDSYASLIDNTNAQLTVSIGLQDTKSEKEIKYGFIQLNNKMIIGVFANEKHLKIFNRERLLAEFEFDGRCVDFFLDQSTEKLNILSLEDKKIEVLQINLGKITKKIDNKLKSFDIHFDDDIKFTILTRNFLLILTGSKYFALNYSAEISSHIEGMFKYNYTFDGKEKFFSFKQSDKVVFVEGNHIHILTLRENMVEITLLEDKIDSKTIFDMIDSKRHSSLFFIRKKNANTFILSHVDMAFPSNYSVQVVSSFNINEEFSLSTFSHNPFNRKFILTTVQNRVYYFDSEIQSPVWTIDNSLSRVQFSELVTYYDELGKEREDVQYHTRLEGLINQKELSAVITNTFTLVYRDVIQICKNLWESFHNAVAAGSNRPNAKEKSSINISHSLIIFTESEDLVVIDALTGLIHFSKHFKNKIAYKIIRNTDEDMNKNANDHIYIIFRDTKTKILSGVKLNLRSIELEEDIMVLNDLLQEEEIKLQCQALVSGNISAYNTSSITLQKNFNKNIIEKYEGKVAIESKENSISGIRFSKSSNGHLDLSIAWNFNIPRNQMPVMYEFPNVNKNVITTYLVNGKIYYRFIDSNLMTILTKIDNKHLLITLLRTSNGKVIHQNQINNVDFTSIDNIKLVFEENFIIVSYVKKEKGFTRNEIFAIEIMKREIEHSFISLLEKIFKFGEYDMRTENISEDNIQESDIVVLTQTYILPRKLKKISVSKSQLNVANKFLIFVLDNNQVFFIDRRVVSPRRPIMKEDKSKGTPPVFDTLMNSPYVDPDLAPYNPIIFLDPKSAMNMEFTNDQIDELKVTPSQYESTFLLCTVGANVGCLKVFPDKMFDALNLQFAYSLIGSFLVGIMVC